MSTETKPQPKELFRQFGPNVYRAAYDKGMSLSAYLEREMPHKDFKDGLDAYERLLSVAGIRVRTMREHGIHASLFKDFEKSEATRALVPEFISRIWRSVASGRTANTRALFSGDEPAGSFDKPWQDANDPRWSERIQPAIPVSELVAISTGINSDAYRSYYLDTDETAEQRMARIAEGKEIPTFKLSGGQHTARLHKFGGGIEASYEKLRHMRIDRVAKLIQLMAVRAEVDKLAAVIDVAVNGDGNSGTAATVKTLAQMDPDATDKVTLRAWLNFMMEFANPYRITHALGQKDVALDLLLLSTGSSNLPLVSIAGASGFSTFKPINPGIGDDVRLGWTSDAPASKIVAFYSPLAIEHVYEIGASITEVERYAKTQTEALYMTEVDGYTKFDPNAVKVLDLS